MLLNDIDRGEKLKGSVHIMTPFPGYKRLGGEALLEFESPTEFDFKVQIYLAHLPL